MIKAVTSAGQKVDNIMPVIQNDKFVLLTKTSAYEFVEATVEEVTGHKDEVTTTQLREAMSALGFIVAPHESACAVCLAYKDQTLDAYRLILSEPVKGANGGLLVQHISPSSDGLYLCISGHMRPQDTWTPNNRLLLCRKC